MNKFIIFFTIAVACAMGAPANSAQEAIRKLPALDHEEVHDEFGQYSLRYVTAEGTIVTETGRLIPNPDGEGMVMVVEGEVTYVGDDGQIYHSKYSAGVDGVKIETSHSPAPLPSVSVLPVAVPAVSLASAVEVAAVPVAPVVEVSAVPQAPVVEVPVVPVDPLIEVSEVRAAPAIEVAAAPSVEVAAVPASSIVEVAAIPPAPLLPALSIPLLSLPVDPVKSEVTVTASR